ncbi:MAG: hypothetical protein H7318_03865 [Oligoflexus sp.]|nr:hypothetical protein [Oligoflexus sp.]
MEGQNHCKSSKRPKEFPEHVKEKVRDWTQSVEIFGMRQTRRIPGWHDEPLKGKRKGQRSIRLNRSYRAIYEESTGDLVEIVEVTNHKY